MSDPRPQRDESTTVDGARRNPEPPADGDVVATRTSRVWLDRSGIVQVAVEVRCDHDIEDAREHVTAVRKVRKGARCPLLVNMSLVRSLSREARIFYMSDPAASAMAFVAGNPLSRMIGNFLIGINKPRVPTRLFESVEAATAWLLPFVTAEGAPGERSA